jgi:hypothetical protein
MRHGYAQGLHRAIGEDHCYKGANQPYRCRKSRTTHRDYATFCLRIVVSLMSHKARTYPFLPKSTRSLLPGQFWALPLSDGSFGCGRVIQLAPSEVVGARVSFLAGVLDWNGQQLPTQESIANAPCLAQGDTHLKAIISTGGVILGHRELDKDGIEPWTFRSSQFWVNSTIQKGYSVIRDQKPSDTDLPVWTTWGYKTPLILCETRFIKHGEAMANNSFKPNPLRGSA